MLDLHVPEPPTTQFQCDHGKEPARGFSIDGARNLLYHGSPDFWACPATDTEYNIYVRPDFGQEKCVPIGLTASGCSEKATSECAPASTVWQTHRETVTEDITQKITVVVTETPKTCQPQTSSETSSHSEVSCHRCTEAKPELPKSTATELELPVSTATADKG